MNKTKKKNEILIKNTMRDGRKKTEKGKLEGQELQFFLSTSDNRLQRVKSGARLFNILNNKQINKKPLQLIEHVITKQLAQEENLTPEERSEREQELMKLLSGDIDMANYLTLNNFDPCQEVLKEKNIQNFFKQKYNILMMYLENEKVEIGQGKRQKQNYMQVC